MFFVLLGCKVMYLGPIAIPGLELSLLKLFAELRIFRAVQAREMDSRTTLNDWLALTIYRKMWIVTIICSELPNCAYDCHVLAISNKYAALDWCSEYKAILTIIDVNIGCYIENKVCPVFASVNIKLLAFDWIYCFHSKLILLLLEIVILWVKLLLLYWRGHYIIFGLWLLFDWFLLFLLFRFLLLLF